MHCIKVVAEKCHLCLLFVSSYVQILSFKFIVEAIKFSCKSRVLSERKRWVGSTFYCSFRNTHRSLKYKISLLMTLMRIFLAIVQVFLKSKRCTFGSWKYFRFLCCHKSLFIQGMLNDHEVNRSQLQPSWKHKTPRL